MYLWWARSDDCNSSRHNYEPVTQTNEILTMIPAFVSQSYDDFVGVGGGEGRWRIPRPSTPRPLGRPGNPLFDFFSSNLSDRQETAIVRNHQKHRQRKSKPMTSAILPMTTEYSGALCGHRGHWGGGMVRSRGTRLKSL